MRTRKSMSFRASSLDMDDTANGTTTLPRLQQQNVDIDRPSPFVYKVTLMASLGGILFGYDLGVISSALPQLTLYLSLSNNQQELVVSILYVGGGIGALVGGSLCDSFGRKQSILLCDVCFLVGALILASATSIAVVVVGRIVVGFAVAVSGIADVSYLHEIAPVQWRGAIVSVNEACISLGFLLAFAAGSMFGSMNGGWRYMFGLSGAIAIIQFLGMLGMPESPAWLREQGRIEESEAALERVFTANVDNTQLANPSDTSKDNERRSSTARRGPFVPGTYDALGSTDSSLPDMKRSSSLPGGLNAAETSAATTSLDPPRIRTDGLVGVCSSCVCQLVYLVRQLVSFMREILSRHRRQTYILLFLSIAQQLCGQTNVLSYASIIFARVVGTDPQEISGWSTLSVGIVKFLVTLFVIWKIEVIGRRVLLIVGMSIIALGLLLLSISFQTNNTTEQSRSQQGGTDDSSGFYFALSGVLFVVCGYSMSFGPLTWLLTSELFPTDIRGRALGLSTIVTYLHAALVTFTFLSSQEWLGTSTVFGIYLIISCLGVVFAIGAIPDTKGKTVEDIEDDLDQMLWWRGTFAWRRRSSAGDTSPLFESQQGRLPESELPELS